MFNWWLLKFNSYSIILLIKYKNSQISDYNGTNLYKFYVYV